MNHQIAQMILAQQRREVAAAAERHRHLFGISRNGGLGRRLARSLRLL